MAWFEEDRPLRTALPASLISGDLQDGTRFLDDHYTGLPPASLQWTPGRGGRPRSSGSARTFVQEGDRRWRDTKPASADDSTGTKGGERPHNRRTVRAP